MNVQKGTPKGGILENIILNGGSLILVFDGRASWDPGNSCSIRTEAFNLREMSFFTLSH